MLVAGSEVDPNPCTHPGPGLGKSLATMYLGSTTCRGNYSAAIIASSGAMFKISHSKWTSEILGPTGKVRFGNQRMPHRRLLSEHL